MFVACGGSAGATLAADGLSRAGGERSDGSIVGCRAPGPMPQARISWTGPRIPDSAGGRTGFVRPTP
jgi:hypothetical protein